MELNGLTPSLLFSGGLAIILELAPGVRTWWANLEPSRKQTYNLLAVFVITLGFTVVPALTGNQVLPSGSSWITEPLVVLLLSVGSNQGLHGGTKILTNRWKNK